MSHLRVLILLSFGLVACPPDQDEDGGGVSTGPTTSAERCRKTHASELDRYRYYECTPSLQAVNAWSGPVVVNPGSPHVIVGAHEYRSYSDLRVTTPARPTPHPLKEDLPAHVQSRLDVLNDETNCFFNAVNFHLPQDADFVMSNSTLAQVLDASFRELPPGETIQYGDILTVQAPSEGAARNYHHAAIVIDDGYLLDKPDRYASPLRITPMSTLFSEWRFDGPNWRCATWLGAIAGYQCLLVRFWRLRS